MGVYNRAPVEVERGEGARLYATDGTAYLDCVAGIATNALGHRHPRLVQALKDQADKLWHTSNIFRIPGQEALADRLVTNAEWDEFIAAGGYRDASLWLADGWGWVQENAITAPLYWRGRDHFTHHGWCPRDPDAPVTHISYFEADAFATFAGCRLPSEFEWEVIAAGHDPCAGHQLDGAAQGPLPRGGDDLFGDCWQFTRSAYLPYPGFRPADGAVGEYNGKFMSGQVILR
ncbi:MAG: aminotransferase class III-fold pyridoxal phosphate-dependent enzyme, partial [Brevundimonas sp.]